MTDARFAVLMQLIGTLLLLSDAFVPLSARKAVDRFLRKNSDGYLRANREQLRSDLKFFVRFIAAWVVLFFSAAVVSKQITSLVINDHRVSAGVLMAIMGIAWVMSIREIKRLAQFSGIYLQLMVIAPICIAFTKAPRGPIYVMGFAFSLVGLVVQFQCA